MDNYYELYGLPEQFNINKAALRKKFLELSREFHPDRSATEDAVAQANALKQSAINNEAYKTLMDETSGMAYLLRLKAVLTDDEKYSLPPAFLMEMMELNELISEYEDAPEESKKREADAALAQALAAWERAVAPLRARYDSGERSEEILLQLKDFYFRKKYLLRIKDRLDTFAP